MMITKTALLVAAGAAGACLLCRLVAVPSAPRERSRVSASPESRREQQEKMRPSNDAYRVWQNDHDPIRAERLYRQALQAMPEDTITWNNYAELLDELGRDREALAAYDRIMPKLNRGVYGTSEDQVIYYRFAHLCEQFGRPAEAMQAYRRILFISERMNEARINDLRVKTDVEEPREVHARACLLAGIQYGGHGEFAKEIGYYQEALRLKPDLAAAHFALALAYDSMRDSYKWREYRPKAQAEYALAKRMGGEEVEAAIRQRVDRAKTQLETYDKRYHAHSAQTFYVDDMGEIHNRLTSNDGKPPHPISYFPGVTFSHPYKTFAEAEAGMKQANPKFRADLERWEAQSKAKSQP